MKWICVVLCIGTLGAQAAEPKRILLLHSFGRDFSPWNEYAKQIRAELNQQILEPVDIFEASLAIARFSDGNREEPFAAYLHSLFENRKLDLAVTIGAPAAFFFNRHHLKIAPMTPAVFMGLEQRRIPPTLASNEITISSEIDFPGAIRNALHVLPKTNHVAVVIGNSPLEKFWLQRLREDFREFTDRVAFSWFNELSFQEMLARSATLPPQSAIFFVVLSVDVSGVAHEESKAVEQLSAVANAPMFAWNDVYLGRGIVGGPLTPAAEAARKAAAVAVRILNGEAPSKTMAESIQFGTPRFDWREMRRWDVDESDLPQGSIVEFRAPTVFQQYKWYITGVAAVCLLQAVLILGLLVNRRRLKREHLARQKAEKSALDFSGRLITAQEDERSRLARELHDDVTQRLALLAIDAGRGEHKGDKKADDASMRTVREGLIRLSEDVHSLSYRLHPSILDDLGLIEALKAECDRFSRVESILVTTKLPENFNSPPRQIALCLFRIAQEALRNISRHAKATSAELSLRSLDNGIQLCVRDDGIGFDPGHHRDRPSLGLASMRQRVYLIGGELEIESSPGHGVIVLAWVPVREERHEAAARVAG